MNLHIETLNPRDDDPLTHAVAKLVTSAVYLPGEYTIEDYVRFLGMDSVVGYALVGDGSELIGGATTAYDKVQTDIQDIAIQEGYRGRRYGIALVRHIAAQALNRGNQRIVAYMPPESDQRRFFQRLGFVPAPGEDQDERRLQTNPSDILS